MTKNVCSLKGLTWPRWLQPFAVFLLAAHITISGRCQEKEPAVIQASKELGVSLNFSHIAYDEYPDGAVLDSEHGWIPGVGVKASGLINALKMTDILVGATYEFNSGTSNHCCLKLNNNGGVSLTYAAPFRSNDLSFGVGKGFLLTPKLLLTAEGEAQYREWLRQLPAAAYDTRENYTFWAPGVAVGTSYNPVSSLVVNGRAGFEYTVSPANAGSGNPNAQVPVPPVTMVLGSHPLWQFGGGGDWTITHAIHAYADANYSRFGFGRSVNYYYGNGKDYHFEPSSVTRLTKVNAGLAWSF